VSFPSENAVTIAERRQYHLPVAEYQRQKLMLEIGAVLGLLYVAFLATWIWATRFRRSRGIDTRGRIE
jgi:hypothetical protein